MFSRWISLRACAVVTELWSTTTTKNELNNERRGQGYESNAVALWQWYADESNLWQWYAVERLAVLKKTLQEVVLCLNHGAVPPEVVVLRR